MITLLRTIALRSLRLKPLRTTLTILGVAFGLSLWVAIRAINASTLDSFRNSVEAVSGKAALTVTGDEAGFPEEVADKVAAVKEVLHAVPMVINRGYFAGDKTSTVTLQVLGVDMLKESSVRTYKTSDQQVIEDPLVFLNQPDSVILTHTFAKEHGLKIDSKFQMATTKGPKSFTVRGLLTPEGPAKAYGGAIALMDIDGARMMFGKENRLDRVDVVLREGVDVNAAKKEIQQAVGPALVVDRPQAQSEDLERLVKSFQVMLEFFSTLSLLVGLVMVTNSVSIAVAERRREIGTLRALGATRTGILTMFIAEAALIGVVGSALGAWLGKITSTALIHDVLKSLASQFVMQVEMPKLEFGAKEVAFALMAGTSASVLAALWPSWKATRVHPLEAIKQTEPEILSADGKIKIFTPLSLTGLVLLACTVVYVLSPHEWDRPILQNLNLLFVVCGAFLVSPALIAALLSALKPIFGKTDGAISSVARIASDNLLRNPRRTTSNTGILMIGLGFVILISAVNISFQGTLKDWLDRILTADLLVSANGNVMSFDVQPVQESISDELAKIPGVKTVPGRTVFRQRYLRIRYHGELVAIKAFTEPTDTSAARFITIGRNAQEAGKDLFHSADDTIFISESFRHGFGSTQGDKVELDTPSGRIPFRVASVCVDYASPKGVIYMKQETYKKYWHDNTVSVFGVAVDKEKGFTAPQVRKSIDEALGAKYNLMVMSNAEIRTQMNQKIDESFVFLHAVEIAALLVAVLGILNTLLVSVMERTREIGLLRAVGMSRGQVFAMILEEAIVQGALASVAAVILGSWVAYAWMTRSLSQILGWVVDFHYPWSAIGMVLVFGVVVAVFAGFLPSRRASRIQIKEALEYE